MIFEFKICALICKSGIRTEETVSDSSSLN